MADYSTYAEKSDTELIELIVSTTGSPDAIAAKEVLEYRKYLAAKRMNQAIVLLTVVLAITAVVSMIGSF